MRTPGFAADAALSIASERYGMMLADPRSEIAGEVLPQMAVDLGCRRTGIGCVITCCWMNIDYVGPYQLPQVTTHCSNILDAACSASGGSLRI